MEIKRVSKQPADKQVDPREFKPEDLISSGSTLLDCACSDTVYGAFKLGTMVTIPGASQGGKTMLALTTLAEAIRLERLKDYRFFYDDVEAALEIDVGYMFGSKTKEKIEEPLLGPSNTVQNFKANILTLTEQGIPFIYVLDTPDALTSDEEMEKEMRKALAMAKSEEAAKKIAGSYGMEKAKMASQVCRMVCSEIKKTNSLIIALRQVRQNMKAQTKYDPQWVTSGGEAWYFYSTHECFLNKRGNIKDKDSDLRPGTKKTEHNLRVGGGVEIAVSKNKLTGKYRKVLTSIYNDYGIDDITSCIDFMVANGGWDKDGHKIVAEDLNLSLRRDDLIVAIEEQNLEQQLKKAVGRLWKEIEDDVKSLRKRRYE